MAAPRAIVDADVLYRRHARNLLVWHAIAGLFQFHWSRRILDETRANLLANVRLASLDRAAKADQILDRVTESLDLAIAGSEVRQDDIDAIEPAMTNHPKDRHVLAAAVACRADTVVTYNTKDFPRRAAEPHGVVARSPDDFLVSLLEPSTRDVAVAALRQHAAFHGWSVSRLLDTIGSAGSRGPAIAPRYARLIARGSGVAERRPQGAP